jgi:hypothetical protein
LALEAKIPDVDSLKQIADIEFVSVVCAAMGRYDMQAPGFNLAANARLVTPLDPTNRALFVYPEGAQDLIFSGLKALHEYDATQKVSLGTREEFILAETKDMLRNLSADKASEEYRALCENVMSFVSSRLTGIGSLVLSPAAAGYDVKISRRPNAPKP